MGEGRMDDRTVERMGDERLVNAAARACFLGCRNRDDVYNMRRLTEEVNYRKLENEFAMMLNELVAAAEQGL